MSNIYEQPVSSLETIIGTINNDPQTYRWFSFLIQKPALKIRLEKLEKFQSSYKNLHTVIFKQNIIYLILAITIQTTFFLKTYYILIPTVILFYPLIKLHIKNKVYTCDISRKMLLEDFKQEYFKQKTLYQISEFYSKKYSIPSLVDAIYHLDDIMRKTLIFIFVFCCWIYPFKNFFNVILITMAFCLLVYFIINTTKVYKTFK